MGIVKFFLLLLKLTSRFRKPRIFSNEELLKFSHLFDGKIVNVSGWNDLDKQGRHYKNYFSKAVSYIYQIIMLI